MFPKPFVFAVEFVDIKDVLILVHDKNPVAGVAVIRHGFISLDSADCVISQRSFYEAVASFAIHIVLRPILSELEAEPVGNHGDKFAVCGFAFYV